MNPFAGLKDPVCAMIAGINQGHARAYLMAARSLKTYSPHARESIRSYVHMARARHHDFLRSLRAAREV